MADARQKEMNVSITVVATNTVTAGRFRSCGIVDIQKSSQIDVEFSTSRQFHERPLLVSRSQVGMCDAIVPAELVFIHEAPCVSQA